MELIDAKPSNGGETTRVTVEMSPEQAKILIDAFARGDLEPFRVMDVQIMSDSAEIPGDWAGKILDCGAKGGARKTSARKVP